MKHTHQQQGIAASDTRDAALLADLGYKQEFIRDFSPFEVFGLGFSIIGVVPSVTSVLPYSLPYGGTLAMVWGWAICSIFLMFIALAVAELGSSAPTSGGLYYWTFHFSSPRYRKLLSWIVGYTNSVAYISAAAAIDWGCSVQIMAAVTMGSNLRFVPSPAQIYGVYCTLLVCHALVASGATKIIARLQSVYILVNIALCLAIIIGLPAATPREFKNTAKYALGHFENMTSWPDGFSFILSFLAPLGFRLKCSHQRGSSQCKYCRPVGRDMCRWIRECAGLGDDCSSGVLNGNRFTCHTGKSHRPVRCYNFLQQLWQAWDADLVVLHHSCSVYDGNEHPHRCFSSNICLLTRWQMRKTGRCRGGHLDDVHGNRSLIPLRSRGRHPINELYHSCSRRRAGAFAGVLLLPGIRGGLLVRWTGFNSCPRYQWRTKVRSFRKSS